MNTDRNDHGEWTLSTWLHKPLWEKYPMLCDAACESKRKDYGLLLPLLQVLEVRNHLDSFAMSCQRACTLEHSFVAKLTEHAIQVTSEVHACSKCEIIESESVTTNQISDFAEPNIFPQTNIIENNLDGSLLNESITVGEEMPLHDYQIMEPHVSPDTSKALIDEEDMTVEQKSKDNTSFDQHPNQEYYSIGYDEYEKMWSKRKRELEKAAEKKAELTFAQWKREKYTLEQSIEESLRDYVELYEKAHALRLHFEEEKQKITSQLQQYMNKPDYREGLVPIRS
jgi:hypothetical protein